MMGPYWEAEKLPTRTRKKGPKTKTGCKTCKARRIKCDEHKPTCHRCEKFGVTCAGYDAPRPSVIFVEPKQQTQRRLAKLAPGPRLPFEFSFEDVREEGYFRLFCEETAGIVGGGEGVWKTLILQACNTEPSILQFTTSISALDRACREKESGSPIEHHQYALQKYQKAVKGIQNVIATRKDTLRIALIAALLIFCFENFHGDIRTAARSTKSAVDCLYAWLEKTPRGSNGLSPKPSVLEDELVGIFCRLGRLLVIYNVMHGSVDGAPGLAARNNDLNPAATLLRSPPSKFKDLSEARKYWEFLAEYTWQHMTRMRAIEEPVSELEESVLDVQRSRIAEGLRSWTEAFDPILKAAWTPEGEDEFIAVTTMHISCHMRAIDVERERLRKTHLQSEIDFIVLPQYATVVSLCRRVIEHPGFVKGFVLEFGILSDLFIVAVKCRDSLVRRSAVKLLRMARPRREAFWDSGVLANMAEGIIKAEEGKVDEDEGVVEEVEEVRVDKGIGEGIPGWAPEERSDATEWDALRKFARR